MRSIVTEMQPASALQNRLTPGEKEVMVAGFLDIAIGETSASAAEFLQAAKWRIEDALELFYAAKDGQIGHFAIDAAVVQNPSCSAACFASFCPSIDSPVEPVVSEDASVEVSSICPFSAPAKSAPRRTRAQMEAAAAAALLVRRAELAKCRATQSYSKGPRTCAAVPPQQLTLAISAPPVAAEFVTRKRRRTRSEIEAVARGDVPVGPVELVKCRRRRSPSKSGQPMCHVSPLLPELGVKLLPNYKRTQLQLVADGYTPTTKKDVTVPRALERINSPHISVFGKSDGEYRIMHYFGCYDPLQYPLLFTKGESGWHQGLKHVHPNSQGCCDAVPFPIRRRPGQVAADIVHEEMEGTVW